MRSNASTAFEVKIKLLSNDTLLFSERKNPGDSGYLNY